MGEGRIKNLTAELIVRGFPPEVAKPIAEAESTSPIVYNYLSLLFREHVTSEQMVGELISALIEQVDTLQEKLTDTLESSVTPVFLVDSPH